MFAIVCRWTRMHITQFWNFNLEWIYFPQLAYLKSSIFFFSQCLVYGVFFLMHFVIQVWEKGNKIKGTVSFPLAPYHHRCFPLCWLSMYFRDKYPFYRLTLIKDLGNQMNHLLPSSLPSTPQMSICVTFMPVPNFLHISLSPMFFPHIDPLLLST